MAQTDERVEFERLLEFVRFERNFDFTGHKRSSVTRRTDKRMHELGIEGYANYLDYLEADAEEFTRLFNTILINVTSFFRDEEMWEYLRESIVPELLLANRDRSIRIWSAGCASGEEPFSVAICWPRRWASRTSGGGSRSTPPTSMTRRSARSELRPGMPRYASTSGSSGAAR